ncbi:hypothetical protein MNV49_005824 [Pseudohyphozyma bogoriensis]|nr:hypothetical protein MNV49_005824 [Pseudohyphozyma bogoriensis]
MSTTFSDPRTPTTALSTEESAPVTGFVSQAPTAKYELDEDKKSSVTKLCRVGRGGKDCVEIQQNVSARPSYLPFRCEKIEGIIER